MEEEDKFIERLNNVHSWPGIYTFKFIVPFGKESEVAELFPRETVTTKKSRNGNYVSVTAKMNMSSAEEVVTVYKKANQIKGVIPL